MKVPATLSAGARRSLRRGAQDRRQQGRGTEKKTSDPVNCKTLIGSGGLITRALAFRTIEVTPKLRR